MQNTDYIEKLIAYSYIPYNLEYSNELKFIIDNKNRTQALIVLQSLIGG